MRRPRDGKHWRVEKRGGASDGLAVECATLQFAMLWFRLLSREEESERDEGKPGGHEVQPGRL